MAFDPDPFLGPPAVAAGRVTRAQLQNRRRFRRNARGLYVPAAAADDLAARCRALLLVLPEGAVFSHHTAAALLGAPVPEERRIHVCVTGTAPIRIKGVVAHRTDPGAPVARHGLPVTSPARTYFDLASYLERPRLVEAGDFLAARCPDGVADLRRLIPTGRRGAARARSALEWLDPDSRSAMESRMRFLLVSAGFPKPRCNQPVYDEVGGFVAEPDLHVEEVLIAHEYESDRHRERRQWELDIKRDEQLHRLGWILIKVTSTDLLRRPATVVERTRDAYARHGVHIPHRS